MNLGTKSNWFTNGDEALLPESVFSGGNSNFSVTISGTITGDGCNQQLQPQSFNVSPKTVSYIVNLTLRGQSYIPAGPEINLCNRFGDI